MHVKGKGEEEGEGEGEYGIIMMITPNFRARKGEGGRRRGR